MPREIQKMGFAVLIFNEGFAQGNYGGCVEKLDSHVFVIVNVWKKNAVQSNFLQAKDKSLDQFLLTF